MFKSKKSNNEEKIIVALNALDKSINNLNKFGNKYNDYIDESAMRGDDARAKQLIKQKIKVYAHVEQLKTLKSHIELGAYTSQAISELGKLPDSIAGCKGLLAESPNFAKLGKSITNIFKDINKSESDLAKLNDVLNPMPTANIESRLDGVSEDETSDQFKAEYEAMMMRLGAKIATEKVAKPDLISNTTDDVDYAGIIEEENRKK